MAQHFLLSTKARTLSLAQVLRLSDQEAYHQFKAILSATKRGVTTKTNGSFCGQGLDLLVQYVVIRNRGKVAIYSGKGGLHCSNNANTVRKAAWLGTGRFPGTLVDIEFNTNNTLLDEDEEEDLEW